MQIAYMKCYLENFNMTVFVNDNKCFFEDYKSNEIQLCNYNFIDNKSKMPLLKLYNDDFYVTLEDNYLDFYKNITAFIALSKNELASEVYDNDDDFDFLYALYIIIFSFGIEICTPIKAAAIGCPSEILYTCGYIIKSLRTNSSLTVIRHTINADGNNDFFEPVTALEDVDFNLLIGDYAHTNLKDNNYDLTVIDSRESYDDLESVIKECSRILNPNGKLVFTIYFNPEFEAIVKDVCKDFKEYAVSENIKVIVSDKLSLSNPFEYLNFNLEELKKQDIKEIINKLNNDIDIAVKNFDTYKKIDFIDLKEYLICFMLFEDDKDFYREKIIKSQEMLKNKLF